MRFVTLAVAFLLFASAAYADVSYGSKDVVLTIDSQGGSISSLKFGDMGAHFVGDSQSAIWRLWFADAACLAENNRPLVPEGQACYYMTEWTRGNCSISSKDAELVSKSWDDKTKRLVLAYTHPRADVQVTVIFGKATVEFAARVINKSSDPLQMVHLPAGWQIVYGEKEENTFIMPLNTSGIEYKSIKNFLYWMSTSAWEGFLVTSPNKLLGVFNIQEDGKDNLLATENELLGQGGYPGRVALHTGTICWRKTGESVSTIRVRIGRFDSIRSYADAYNKANFPNMRKLREKMPATLYDKLSGAVLMPAGGKFEELAKTVKQLPGVVVIHTPEYMHKTAAESGTWDAFPNYFPPNPEYGTMEGLKDMISRVNKSGHIYMPRTSFFYWAKGSDADLKYGGDSLAMRRVDDKPQIARWGNDGWIVSPSSKNALSLMHGFYDTWKSLGASMYFTNVIGALAPLGHRYDFHPDTPGPDLLWDQIYKLMAWHGYKMPLFTEVGCSRQVPYQAGICTEPSWGPSPQPEHWRQPWRGDFIRYREEMQTYIGHEYCAMYPSNIGPVMQYSLPQVSFSVLHGYQFKCYATTDSYRWQRMLAVLGQKVSKPLYGKRLLGFKRDVVKGVHKANYEGNIVLGNFSHEPFTVKEGQIVPEGFSFTSKDGKIIAGAYSELYGHQLERPEILVVDCSESGKTKVYAPNADEDITLFLPVESMIRVKATACYSDREKRDVPIAVGKNGVLVRIPAFKSELTKFIPHVAIETAGTTSVPGTQPVIVQARWAKNDGAKLTYTRPVDLPETLDVNVRVENFKATSVTGALRLSGTVIGQAVNLTTKVTAVSGVSNITIKIPRPSAEKAGLIDLVSIDPAGFVPFAKTEALSLQCDPLPKVLPRLEAESICPLVADWDMMTVEKPSGVDVTESDTLKETYGRRFRGNNDSNVLVGGPNVQFKKKIYLECVIKFHKLPDEGETQLIYARGPAPAKIARSLELRHSSSMNCLRWLITSKETICDVSNTEVQIVPGKWYHVVAYYDGTNQILRINGKEAKRNEAMPLIPYQGPLQVAAGLDCTLAYLRIGGE